MVFGGAVAGCTNMVEGPDAYFSLATARIWTALQTSR